MNKYEIQDELTSAMIELNLVYGKTRDKACENALVSMNKRLVKLFNNTLDKTEKNCYPMYSSLRKGKQNESFN